MVKNVVFDIGNVLVYFGWKEHVKKFNLPEDIEKRVIAASVADPDWNEIDKGILTANQVMELFVENDPEVGKYTEMVFGNISGMLTQYDYTKDWIRDLQGRGYKVYCLSNMSYKACEECAEALNFLPLLDGYILSCEVKENKPGPRIYEILFEKYGLKPQECVFVDDLEKNVEAARAQGMHGIVFKGKEEAEAAIASL